MNPLFATQFKSVNLYSGAFVALIALPLSMGIAVASGFPALSGVLTAIVGGLVTGLIGGAKVTIKGPAAGMIVIVLGAVTEFSSLLPSSAVLPTVLAVVCVSGFFQVLLGLLGLANLALLIPGSIIHGMLAAIGVLIIGKQVHLALGVVPSATSALGLFAEIPQSIQALNPAIACIGLISFLIMAVWVRLPAKAVRALPNALVVVVLAVVVSLILDIRRAHAYGFLGHQYLLNSTLLVSIPASILSAVQLPLLSSLGTLVFWKHVLLFTVVGSIESVLTVTAIDALNKSKTRTDLNRDLLAVGLGNMLCGFIGGLPMISEVVRSKANLDSGATSQWSNWFHGLFLLIAVVCAPSLLASIPLAALAGILVYVGTRLASPRELFHVKELGWDQATFFILTLVLTVSVDLLVGVLGSLLLYFLFCCVLGRDLLGGSRSSITSSDKGLQKELHVQGPATFLTTRKLLDALNLLPPTSNVVINLRDASFIDHSFLAQVDSIMESSKERSLEITGLDTGYVPFSSHSLATRLRRKNPSECLFRQKV